eukprot:2701252-Rhodomonas_salina.6
MSEEPEQCLSTRRTATSTGLCGEKGKSNVPLSTGRGVAREHSDTALSTGHGIAESRGVLTRSSFVR